MIPSIVSAALAALLALRSPVAGETPAKRAAKPVREPKAERVKRAKTGSQVAVQFTKYCLSGLTRRDHPVRDGIVAADPRVFRLGRHVDLFLGTRRLGRFLVDDTGALVKGHVVDIWTSSCRDARRFGRREGIATLVTVGSAEPTDGEVAGASRTAHASGATTSAR